MKLEGGTNNPNAQGHPHATVVAAPQQPHQPFIVNQTCSCAVPADAHDGIQQTRILAIVVIVVHAIALFAFGFYNWAQWIGSLAAIISAGVLLCCYQKGTYTCAPFVWIAAAVFDVAAAVLWLIYVGWLSIFPIAGVAILVPAIVCGFRACNGFNNTVPNATPTGGPVVTVLPTSAAAHTHTSATVSQMPQSQPPPPYYAGNNV